MARKPGSLATLQTMLQYCRPAGSATERAFIARWISTLPNAERDPFGNWHVTVSDDPILWSCHTDTVHWREGIQTVLLDRDGVIRLAHPTTSSCLGADDTAGVWLAREMILARVPGHYVFHYGEERGGIGSRALAESMPEFLQMFQCAIALDRQGTGDVITHQGGMRTASDAFAQSLADVLNVDGLTYTASENGIYTDTAEYAELIPECTNVSVGYYGAHTAHERLHTDHLSALLTALCRVRFGDLTLIRDPLLPDDVYDTVSTVTVDEDGYLLDDDEDEDMYLSREYAEVMRQVREELRLQARRKG